MSRAAPATTSRPSPTAFLLVGGAIGLTLIVALAFLAAWLGTPGTERLQPLVAPEGPGFWDDYWKNLRDVAGWAFSVSVYGITALGLAWCLTCMRRFLPPADRTTLDLEDRTPSGSPASSTKLVREVADACRRLTESGDRPMLYSVQSSTLPTPITTTGDLARFASHVDDTPIKVGPVSFSPRQLFRWISALVRRPPKRVITGALIGGGDRLRVTATIRSHGQAESDASSVHVEAEGDDVRQRVIERFAAHIMAREVDTVISKVPESLAAYLRACVRLRDSAGTSSPLTAVADARRLLEDAVRHDPTNLPARLLLGEQLHLAHDYSGAIAQTEFVRDLLIQHNDQMGQPHPLAARFGDIFWRCRFRLVSSMTQMTDRANRHRARKDCRSLAAGRQKAGYERLIYVRMARVLTRLQNMEHMRLMQRHAPKGKYRKALRRERKRILAVEEWFWGNYQSLLSKFPNLVSSVHALLLTACGRAHYLCGKNDRAQQFLNWVITLYRPAVDSRPYIFQASVLMRWRRGSGVNWRARTHELLTSALAISPHSPRANYLMGKWIETDPDGDPEDADRYYAKDQAPPGLFARGRLWIERLGREDGGLELIRRSLEADQIVDHRVPWVAAHLHRRALTGGISDRQRRWLRKLLLKLKEAEHGAWLSWGRDALPLYGGPPVA